MAYFLEEYCISNQDGGHNPGSSGSTLEEVVMSEQRHTARFIQEKVCLCIMEVNNKMPGQKKSIYE